jgi:DNA-binding protein H-NS
LGEVVMLPLLLKLRALPWRFIGAVALVLLAWWQVSAYAERRADAREAEIRALWEADELAERQEADRQAADNAVQEAAAAARNEGVINEWKAKHAAAVADAGRYYRLLRDARTAASRSPPAQGGDQPGAAPAGEAGGAEGAGSLADRIDRAIAAVLVEARQNADAKDALLAELVPQLEN